MKNTIRRVKETLPAKVVEKAQEDNVPSQAVLIAWSGLQSMFPIVLALVAILGAVVGSVGLNSKSIVQFVAAAIPDPGGQQQVMIALQGVRTQAGLFGILAIIGFLWSASSLFGTMEQAFDVMFHVPKRSFVRQKLMAVLMMLILGVLGGVALISSTLLTLVGQLRLPVSAMIYGPVAVVVQFIVGAAAGSVLFFAIYYVVPNRKQKARQVRPGALFAGVAFEVLTLAFPIYLHFTGHGMNQYGRTFALLFILMAFFYFVGLVTMLGMEINAALYPVPIPQPARAEALSPAATGGGEEERESAAREEKVDAAERRGNSAKQPTRRT
jgi:membrane protein